MLADAFLRNDCLWRRHFVITVKTNPYFPNNKASRRSQLYLVTYLFIYFIKERERERGDCGFLKWIFSFFSFEQHYYYYCSIILRQFFFF